MALVMAEHGLCERRACKLIEVDRTSYRYEPQPDRDGPVRAELIALARRGFPLNHKKLCRLYREVHLAVRRLKRKRLRRDTTPLAELTQANQA